MAAYQATYQTDLAAPSRVISIPHVFAMGDNESHTFTALVYNSRDPECGLMDGSVSGVVVRPDGGTVPLTGEKGEDVVEVTLPDGSTAQATACTMTLIQGCFAFPGQITIVIRLIDGDQATAVLVARGTVTTSLTETIVDPGDVVEDITQLIAQAEQASEDALDALEQASNVVSYAAQTPSVSEQAQARANLNAPMKDAVYNMAHAVEFVEPERTASGSQSGMAYTRTGNRVTLNGEVTRFIIIRMYGNASHGTSSYNVANNNPGYVTLTPGRVYALAARQIGGTVGVASNGGVIFTARLAETATDAKDAFAAINLKPWQKHAQWGYTEFSIPADAANTTIGVFVSLNNRTICTNATFEVGIYDVTDYNPFNDEAIAPGECVVAKANRTAGDIILLGGQLFKVTANYAAGSTVLTTNLSATSVAEELAALS